MVSSPDPAVRRPAAAPATVPCLMPAVPEVPARLAAAVRPALREGRERWTGPDGRTLTPFRPVSADPADLALLADAAARLTSTRRRREGALTAALAVTHRRGRALLLARLAVAR